MWKKFIKDYLTFTKRQRIGLFTLLGIIILCNILPLFFPYFKKERKPDDAAFKKAVSEFMAKQKKPDSPTSKGSQPIKLFPFDPNSIGLETWQKLGLPKGVATIILNYRKAGGHFYKKEDLKKIYGLSDSVYRRLKPFVQIKSERKNRKKKPVKEYVSTAKTQFHQDKKRLKTLSKEHKYKRLVIDINKADSAAWSRLYGIGPVLSARIVRFRKALGGFYNVGQVAEVYGLPDSTFQRIKSQLNISKVSLKKLNINTTSVEKLKSHPYIKWRLANAIKTFRDMHGKFDSLPQLKQLQLVDDKIYRKLVPYLTVK